MRMERGGRSLIEAATVHERVALALTGTAEGNEKGWGIDVSVDDAPRDLSLSEIPVCQSLDGDGVSLDVENGNVGDNAASRTGPVVVVSSSGSTLE